mmetsp:Transcript_6246/g.22862  ORF Transcript_6246/g.22862 Transcript_6246/m.22862 type:complete len:255 (+) Transcript_6246:570-1334(+)
MGRPVPRRAREKPLRCDARRDAVPARSLGRHHRHDREGAVLRVGEGEPGGPALRVARRGRGVRIHAGGERVLAARRAQGGVREQRGVVRAERQRERRRGRETERRGHLPQLPRHRRRRRRGAAVLEASRPQPVSIRQRAHEQTALRRLGRGGRPHAQLRRPPPQGDPRRGRRGDRVAEGRGRGHSPQHQLVRGRGEDVGTRAAVSVGRGRFRGGMVGGVVARAAGRRRRNGYGARRGRRREGRVGGRRRPPNHQ